MSIKSCTYIIFKKINSTYEHYIFFLLEFFWKDILDFLLLNKTVEVLMIGWEKLDPWTFCRGNWQAEQIMEI